MTQSLNQNCNSRIVINDQAGLSADCRTIVRALQVDGVWYDIDIDFQSSGIGRDMIPKIQTIWARMAEQAVNSTPRNSSPLQMECSYDVDRQSASMVVLSNQERKDVAISVNAL